MPTPSQKNSGFAPAVDPLHWYLQSLDVAGYWRNNPARCLVLFAQFSLAYAALVAIGYGFSLAGGSVVIFWPAAGLLVGVLWCTPRRTWPIWLAGTVLGRVAFDLLMLDGRAVTLSLGFSVTSCAEALILAAFMKKPLEQAYRLRRPLYLLVALIVLAFVAAAVGGLLGASMAAWLIPGYDAPFWEGWRLWVGADFLGILAVSPLMTHILLPQARSTQHVARPIDYLLLLATSAVSVGLMRYGVDATENFAAASNVLVALTMTVPVFWAAARFDFPIIAVVKSSFILMVIYGTASGVGPFALGEQAMLPVIAGMQIYLIVTVSMALLLGFLLVERMRAAGELQLHRGLGNVMVTLTDKLVGADSRDLDTSIEQVLEEIGQFAGADRCVLLQSGNPSAPIRVTHRWFREGIAPPPESLVAVDPGRFPWVLSQFAEQGYVAIDNPGKGLPAGAEELEEIFSQLPELQALVCIGLYTDGQLTGAIACSYTARSVRWNSDALSLMYLVGQLFSNVLKRKNAERSLELYQDKLRSLAIEVSMSEERARRRTAIDLHDGIGQNLAVARMKIGQLLAADSAKHEELTQLRNLVDDALRGTRHVIADLSPSILYELGLVPALQSLAERFENANELVCVVEETGKRWRPGNEMRIALYRAVQEFLNNVARHAQAANVRIAVTWSNTALEIGIADDGVGFDTEDALRYVPETSGFGLFSVREAIVLLGGSLDIKSTRGLGTTIRLCVPRHEEEDEE